MTGIVWGMASVVDVFFWGLGAVLYGIGMAKGLAFWVSFFRIGRQAKTRTPFLIGSGCAAVLAMVLLLLAYRKDIAAKPVILAVNALIGLGVFSWLGWLLGVENLGLIALYARKKLMQLHAAQRPEEGLLLADAILANLSRAGRHYMLSVADMTAYRAVFLAYAARRPEAEAEVAKALSYSGDCAFAHYAAALIYARTDRPRAVTELSAAIRIDGGQYRQQAMRNEIMTDLLSEADKGLERPNGANS